MRIARNLLILLSNAFCSIDHQKNDIASINGAERTNDAVAFDRLFHLTAAAHPCRIDQRILDAVLHKVRINGIARRPRNVADNDALFAENLIDDRAFTDVWSSDDSNANLIVVMLIFHILWKRRHHSIEKVTDIHEIRC